MNDATLALALASLTIAGVLAGAYALLRTAQRDLRTATRAMYVIARSSLDQPAPEPPIINVSTPEPNIHVDLASEPPAAPTFPDSFALDPYPVDPTDGTVPRINVDWDEWRGDPTDETSYTPDPADSTLP